ncbi:MAG: class I SAM-dependent methyltransferase [Phycisphaerae bacterium]
MAQETYRLKRMARCCAGRRRILDLGCADMPNPYLANPEVVGLDLADADLPANYTDFKRGDVMDLPRPFGPASFDAIHAGELIEHLERPVEFLRGCLECLRPGGIMVLSTPNPNSPIERLLTIPLSRRFFYGKGGVYQPFGHICLYPQRWLIRILEVAGFTGVKLSSGGFPLPGVGLVPFPRPWCYQTIAEAARPA